MSRARRSAAAREGLARKREVITVPTTRSIGTFAVLLAEGLIFGLAGVAIGLADDAPGAVLIGVGLFAAFASAALCSLRRRGPATNLRAAAPDRDNLR